MMELILFLIFFIGIMSLVMAFNEPDGEGMFCDVIVGIGMMLILIIIGFNCDCSDENCAFHHANAGKSRRTTAVKTADVHQKFLDSVKDDPDFKIYFEKN